MGLCLNSLKRLSWKVKLHRTPMHRSTPTVADFCFRRNIFPVLRKYIMFSRWDDFPLKFVLFLNYCFLDCGQQISQVLLLAEYPLTYNKNEWREHVVLPSVWSFMWRFFKIIILATAHTLVYCSQRVKVVVCVMKNLCYFFRTFFIMHWSLYRFCVLMYSDLLPVSVLNWLAQP